MKTPLKRPATYVDERVVLVQVRIPTLGLKTILLGVALAMAAGAQQYSFRYFGVEDGLTNLAVKVLFQDRTGFLCAGTESGKAASRNGSARRWGGALGFIGRGSLLNCGDGKG